MFTQTNASNPPRHPGSRLRRLGLAGARALAAPHGLASYRALTEVSPSPPGALPARVKAVERPAERSLTLRLEPSPRWGWFRAGQSVALTVEVDGALCTRAYSPAGSEHSARREVELTIRRHEQGLVSRHLHEHARPEMPVWLGPAAGAFVLPEERPERVLLISGGSGITPVLSMLRTLCAEGHQGEIAHVHFTRTLAEHPYAHVLADLAPTIPHLRLRTVATRERPASRAHLTRALIAEVLPEPADWDAFVCGPGELVAAARRVGKPLGWRVSQESFDLPRGGVTAGGRICFTRSGRERESDGGTLLEQAERARLSPAHGCRMGICHTCTTRKLRGRVRDVRSGALSAEGSEDVQLCVSVPDGYVEVDL